MEPSPSSDPSIPSFEDTELLSCVIAAPSREIAAEWLGFSTKHLRHRLQVLREEHAVENNQQLIVLASVNGWIEPSKVLPFSPATDDPIRRN